MGLSLESLDGRYILDYPSLTDNHYRQIAQVAPFHLGGIVNEHTFVLWKALSRLCALFYAPVICPDFLEEYFKNIQCLLFRSCCGHVHGNKTRHYPSATEASSLGTSWGRYIEIWLPDRHIQREI